MSDVQAVADLWRRMAWDRYKPFLKYATPALQEIDPAGIAWVDPHEYDPEAVRILWAIESGICPPTRKDIAAHLQRIFEDMFWFGQGLHRNVRWDEAAFRVLGAWHRYRVRRATVLFAKPCTSCEATRLPADHPALLGPQDYKGEWLGVTYYPCGKCGRLSVRAVCRSEYPILETGGTSGEHERKSSSEGDDPHDVQVTAFPDGVPYRRRYPGERLWRKVRFPGRNE